MLQGVLERFVRAWLWEPAPGWQRHFAFLAPAGILLTAVAYVGAVRTHACGHDVLFMLNTAWRILCGQRPHVDYLSSLGPVHELLVAAGLALAGLRAEGIGYAAALGGAVTGAWGYALAMARMRFVPSVLMGFFLVLLAGAPVPLGAGPASLSHAMAYNRLAFALLALVIMEVMTSPGSEKSGLLSGISTGLAVALLLFLKASFFFVAITLVAGFAVFQVRRKRRGLGLAFGFLLVLALVLIYLRGNTGSFLDDQILAAWARGGLVGLPTVLRQLWSSQGILFLTIAVAITVTLGGGRDRRAGKIDDWKWPAAAIAVYAAGILLLVTNGQDQGLPLSVVLLLLMAGLRENAEAGGGQFSDRMIRTGLPVCALVSVLAWAAAVALDGAALAEAVREKIKAPPHAGTFLPAHMSGLLLYDLGDAGYPLANSNGTRYTEAVNEGIRLLQARSGPRESVVTLEQIDPFSYALLRKPARGGYAFLGFQASFNDRHKPPAERILGEADIVMVPKKNFTDMAGYNAILRSYLPYVKSAFTLAAESPTWWMYRRRCHSSTGTTPPLSLSRLRETFSP